MNAPSSASAAQLTEVLTVGVLTELDGESRVALDPATVARLIRDGRRVSVQRGAGLAAAFPDTAYGAAGATLTDAAGVLDAASVIVAVALPIDGVLDALRPGQTLVGLLDPLNHLRQMQALISRGVTVIALELLPRTLSRAQGMDAMSSQSSVAGYRAALVAAQAFGRYLPMMVTASGTAIPARVIVLGAGVAGLQAIATIARLGAVVTGYDVRPSSRGEVESLGADFLTPSTAQGAGTGGYARALTADEQHAQQAELSDALVRYDIIITTARVPGRIPPLLVTEHTLARLKRGSVCLDLGCSPRGGNVAGSTPGRTLTDRGVIVIGAGDLAADLPTSASQMFAHNIAATLDSVAHGGPIRIDPDDEIHEAIVVGHDGKITSPLVRAALDRQPAAAANRPAPVAVS